MQKRKLFFRMITASLLRRRSRMLVALLAIAIGATILAGLVTLYYDVPKQMGAQFRNYGANLILAPTEGTYTEETLEEALAVFPSENLVGATAYRYANIRVHEQPLLAVGTQFESVQKTSPYWLVDGQWPQNPREALIGQKVAASLELQIGEKTTFVYTPEDKNLPDTQIDFTVTGIIHTGGSEENYIYLEQSQWEELTGIPNRVDLTEVSLSASGKELEGYVEKINQSNTALKAQLVKRVTASETTVLSKLQSLVLIVTVVVLALTMICVATTMTAVVSERRSEIGLRKAIGASDRSILAEFLGEGILLGAFGGLLGAFVGFGFAQFVSVNVFSSYILFRPLLVPVTILSSIGVTALACLIPIRSATRVDPALVLKGE